MKKRPVALIIRDGWGISPQGISAAQKEGNVPLLAKLPFHEHLYATCPQSTLSASGLDVGLPVGQMGNSEVGHLNLGAGRIVYQDLTRIQKAIYEGDFFENPILTNLFGRLKVSGKRLHLWGLLSDGGVHSHLEHLIALLKAAKKAGLTDVYIHVFMDGRDTSPTAGKKYLAHLMQAIQEIGVGTIATMIGRYFAMDRDKRWERTELAYDLIFLGKGEKATDPIQAIEAQYQNKKTDEFILPIVFVPTDKPLVQEGDGILFFNFRADRTRQLCEVVLKSTFVGFSRDYHPQVDLVTMTEYQSDYGVPVLYPPQSMKNILGEVVSHAGLTQLRMAETEKYPHVTYFFNGGIEAPYPQEDRQMVASPKVATYDLQPEMSAPELTDLVVSQLKSKPYDLLILNYANPDMVGHTGSIPAAIKAVETVDACLKRVVETILAQGGCALITADHGNCDRMIAEDGSPYTAHTTNLVQLIYVGADSDKIALKKGILADIAPTLLDLLGLPKPVEMTGSSLIVQK
ncbi:MAG: 2,3-bisphosphoglycerate-independent phosphoglycerate mutase [Verrucomicrobiota bacterium]